MGLKKRSKVTALFNMSSLTDIIFLLLIFFMLTSSLVAPNALNLKLPGQSNANTPPTDKNIDAVVVFNDCSFTFNGDKKTASSLETTLRQKARAERNYTVTIAYRTKTPTECVVTAMDISRRLSINGILVSPKAR